MLKLDARNVERLRSPGGDRFAAFVNTLLRAHARAHGLPDSTVRTNLQTNVGDGGVDAEIAAGAPLDVTGWLTTPTVWQFKATESKEVTPKSLRTEINKPYTRQRIEEGFTYYVCIADQLTPRKKESLESELRKCAAAINPAAPPPRVLDANDLAAFANLYPAFALEQHPSASTSARTLSVWGRSARAITPHYVSRPALTPVQDQIVQHVTFSKSPDDVVLTLRGTAGVGKSRLVYETLSGVPGADGLVLYCDDEAEALRIARHLSNSSSIAIVVVDECSAPGRERLRQILDGYRDRVRVVAIDTSEHLASPQVHDGLLIEGIVGEALDAILAENFPGVAWERRRAYAELANGFVRFAVDLCRHDHQIGQKMLASSSHFVHDYLVMRLNGDEQQAIEAIALFDAVGFRNGMEVEFDSLSTMLGLDSSRVQQAIFRMHSTPGLVATAGRYWTVKPAIVAQVAFDRAWARWAAVDPDGFLNKLLGHPRLLRSFLRRVATSASVPVRAQVSSFFRKWTAELDETALAAAETLDLLIALAEIDCRQYLPVLRRLVAQASLDTLLSRSPNRQRVLYDLARAARRLSALPECFYDAEAILSRLAIVEAEAKIGDALIRDYQQLFKLINSGTAIPFTDRVALLRDRIFSSDREAGSLALSALGKSLDIYVSRSLDEPTIAGQIPPEEWQPGGSNAIVHTPEEAIEAYQRAATDQESAVNATVEVLQAVVTQGPEWARDQALTHAIDSVDDFVKLGQTSHLPRLLPPEHMGAKVRAAALAQIKKYLPSPDSDSGSRRSAGQHVPDADIEVMEKLVNDLEPSDLHGRLVATVGVGRWQLGGFDPSSPWSIEVDQLAQAFIESPDLFSSEVAWLSSSEAQSANYLGEVLGTDDHEGVLLDLVMKAAAMHGSSPLPLAIGYVTGLTNTTNAHNDRLNELLDDMETSSAQVAFSLATSGGDATRGIERAVRLVKQGSVSAVDLRAFDRGLKSRALNDQEFLQVLQLLLDAIDRNVERAADVAVEMITMRMMRDRKKPKRQQLLRLKQAQNLLWRLLDSTVDERGDASYGAVDLLTALAPTRPQHAACLAIRALATHGYRFNDKETRALQMLAIAEPDAAINEIGRAAMEARTIPSSVPFRSIIENVPSKVVENWLEDHGVDGAVALAVHLPPPLKNAKGQVDVPELTDKVLRKFGHDARVVSAICQGSFLTSQSQQIGEKYARHHELRELANASLAHPAAWVRDWARCVLDEVSAYFDWMKQLDDLRHEARFR